MAWSCLLRRCLRLLSTKLPQQDDTKPNKLTRKTTNPPKNGMSVRRVTIAEPTKNCCCNDRLPWRIRHSPTKSATPNDPTREMMIAVRINSEIRGIPMSVIARNTLTKVMATIAPTPARAVEPECWRNFVAKFSKNCGLVCKIINPRIAAATAALILKMTLKK